MSCSDTENSCMTAPTFFLTQVPNAGGDQEGKEKQSDGKGKDVQDTINNTGIQTPCLSEFLKTVNDDINSVEPDPLVYTPSRLNTFTTLRTTLAKMESDYTEFKITIAQSLHEIETTMTEGGTQTKDKLCQLDNTLKLRIKNLEQELDEMRNCQTKMMGEISKLTSVTKHLQDQLTATQKQNSNLVEQQTIMKNELESHRAQKTSTMAVQSPENSTPPHDTTPESDMVAPEVQINNRFGIFQDVQEHPEDNPQNLDMAHAHDFVTPQNGTKNRNRKSETTTGNNRQQNQTATNNQRINEKTDTVILCDSNGKYLRLKKLCPDKKTTYLRCHTINRGNEIIATMSFDSPEIILIHTGTNDLEQSDSVDHLASEISNMITSTATKYPSTKVLYSTLLPQQDVSAAEISEINSLIEKRCSRLANVLQIDHSNLHLSQSTILHDSKHLNQASVRMFAKNLKNTIYGRRPATIHRTDIRSNVTSPGDHRSQATPRTQDYIQAQAPTYAAVVQHPSPTPMIHTPTTPRIHTPTTEVATLPATDIQRRPDQGGKTNISIPMKILPLIQFLNNLMQ